MKKLGSGVLVGLIALGLLLCALLVLLPQLINTDELKSTLLAQVKAQTGREVVIEGDIGWRLLPCLRLTLPRLTLKNPPGFPAGNTLSLESASMGVEWRPLFSHQLKLQELRLIKPQLNITILADGRNNLADLLSFSSAPASSSAPSSGKSSAASQQAFLLSLAGLSVRNGSLLYQDARQGVTRRLDNLDLTLSTLALNTPISVVLETQLSTESLQASLTSSAMAHFVGDFAHLSLDNWHLVLQLQQGITKLSVESEARLQLTPSEGGQLLQLSGWQTQGALQQGALQASWHSDAALTAQIADGLQRLTLPTWQLSGKVSGVTPPQLQEIALQGGLDYQAASKLLILNPLKVSSGPLAAQGQVAVRFSTLPEVHFDLHTPRLDLAWFKQADNPAASSAKVANAEHVSAEASRTQTVKPVQGGPTAELSLFRQVNGGGQWRCDELLAPDLVVKDLSLAMTLGDGLLQLSSLTAHTYQGQLMMSGRLESRQTPVSWQLSPKISGVQIGALLQNLTGKSPVSGLANLSGALTAKGLGWDAWRQSVTGQLALRVADGAIHGVNIAAMLRDAKAALKGKPATHQVQRTDFTELTADFSVRQGLVSTHNIHMLSPLLRVQGAGTTHLGRETLDFLLDVAVVGSAKGQGGAELDSLKHVLIPLKIGGSWEQPTYSLDAGKLLKQEWQHKAEQGLQQQLQKKLGKWFG